MSAADDVLEMQTLSAELADRLAGRGADAKTRIKAVSGAVGVGWNRAFEFLKGRARRVDAWEKEHAANRLAELRRLEAVNQIANLNRTLQYLKTTDPDGYRTHIDSVERSLAEAGVLDRTLAATDRGED